MTGSALQTTEPPLGSLVPDLGRLGALRSVASRHAATLAVADSARAMAVAGLAAGADGRVLVVVVPRNDEAERLANDLASLLGEGAVEWFPAWETLPFERVSPGVETMGRRLRTLARLSGDDRPSVVVAPVRALLQRLDPAAVGVEPVRLAAGDRLDPDELIETLVEWGYRREYQVEHRGEVARRGSIVDVFGSTADEPVRIEFFDVEVDRLTSFSVATQRSAAPCDRVELVPARELMPGRAERERAAALMASEPWGREHWQRLIDGERFDGMESWLPWLVDEELVLADLLETSDQLVLCEPRRLRDRAEDLLAEEADLARSLATTWGVETEGEQALPRLHLGFERLLERTGAGVTHLVAVADGPDSAQLEVAAWEPVSGDHQRLMNQIRQIFGDGGRVIVAAEGAGSAERLVEALGVEGITARRVADGQPAPRAPGIWVMVAPLERGAYLPEVGVGLLTEADLSGRRSTHRRARPRRRAAQRLFEDLQPGDHVVHHVHGIARFEGMVTRTLMGVEKDYLLLAFRGADKIYLPSDQIDLIRPYSGGETPSLSRMGGADWAKTKAKVRSAAQEIAQELVVLYQRRAATSGHAHEPDSPWQRQLEDDFPFAETPDQLEAIEAVKADMESDTPMDRLICGDVGFGKTEVALRAVFKAVQSGKQAAVLVPTTLLAQQHFSTFAERFAPYPVRVEVISRFLTAAQQRAVLEGVATGSVDVVVGTHRLLGGDVRFGDLGLLVVDEEQRFGVTHKEQIKQLSHEVDVLTLSATPIPRTLEMALTGIRDLTLLQTPPAERQPILTYVGAYDERAVAEAIRRELLREGQVFFVHNRVSDIEQVADDLRALVPEARVAVAHGQMDEGSLEQVVLDFWEGSYDVLVCTTIIESGIDMPTVNTLVVDRADRLGLGQLHQLRGRVGRAGQRAYAYLFHPEDVQLTEEAYERLKTIGEATELGSGFRIAMRDLEIRGAGNLLGDSQSGHIAAVGYDLYVQMVTEAVAELKGEPVPEPGEVRIDLPVDAHLPDDYVAREELRLEAYRRLAGVTSPDDVDDIRAEWLDRFGAVPPAAEALLTVARLRAECHRLGIREVGMVAGGAARLSPVELRPSQQVRLTRWSAGAVHKPDLEELHLPVPRGADPAETIIGVLRGVLPPEGEDPEPPEELVRSAGGRGSGPSPEERKAAAEAARRRRLARRR